MKLDKTKSVNLVCAAVALSGVALISASMVNAQQTKTTTAVQLPSETTPRVPGTFTGGSIATTKYAPACAPFVFDMDADAINRARDRAFVVAENARFNQLRDRWDNYENCITINARRDIDAMRDLISDHVTIEAEKESTGLNALNTAATSNLERVKALAVAKKAKAAAATETAPTSNWVKPEGRQIGSVQAGPIGANSYIGGCPVYQFSITAQNFATVTTGAGFNALIEALKQAAPKITEARECRNDNGQKDYTAVQNVIQDGLNAVYVPAKTNFENKYVAVRNQLNLQREPGGLLAASNTPRPAAAPKAKAKKKK